MKKLILALLFISSVFAQNTNNFTVVKLSGGLMYSYYMNYVDSLGTFTSPEIDGSNALAFAMTHQNQYGTDTNSGTQVYQTKNTLFTNTKVDGTIGSDSLEYLYLQGAMIGEPTFATFDTIATKKTTIIKKQINFVGVPQYTRWRIKGAVLLGTHVAVWVNIFVPYINGGSGQGHSSEYEKNKYYMKEDN